MKALQTRDARTTALAGEQTDKRDERRVKAAVFFATLPAARGRGNGVRARVNATPEEWALTDLACDTDVTVPLVEHLDGLHCPVCGARYDRIPGAGVGPVAIETLADPPPPRVIPRQ